MEKFTCADQDGQDYAAVEVKEGPTVFFLTWKDNAWDVATSDEVCGTASAGYPPEILDYCANVSASD